MLISKKYRRYSYIGSLLSFSSRKNVPIFKNVINTYIDKLDNDYHFCRFQDRFYRIVKMPSVIASTKLNNKYINSFIYLCKDVQIGNRKAVRFLSSSVKNKLTISEIMSALKKFGIFGIMSTRDIPIEQVLSEYHLRQLGKMFFDYCKNYGKFVPVQQQSPQTLSGHLLLSFIASFFHVLINNRLGVLDDRYAAPPSGLAHHTGERIEQVPLKGVFDRSSSHLFHELRGHKATVFHGCILPSCPVQQVRDFYTSFGVPSPLRVVRTGEALIPEYASGTGEVDATRIFAQKAGPLTKQGRSGEKRQDRDKKRHQPAEQEDLPKQHASEDPQSME